MAARVPRLKRRFEFVRAARHGRRWVTPGMILQAWRHTSSVADEKRAAPIRVGFTASRKVGNAVERNRVRRRLRAAADAVLPRCAKAGRDYVLIGRAKTLTRPFDALLSDLTVGLKALDCLRAGEGATDGRDGGEERNR